VRIIWFSEFLNVFLKIITSYKCNFFFLIRFSYSLGIIRWFYYKHTLWLLCLHLKTSLVINIKCMLHIINLLIVGKWRAKKNTLASKSSSSSRWSGIKKSNQQFKVVVFFLYAVLCSCLSQTINDHKPSRIDDEFYCEKKSWCVFFFQLDCRLAVCFFSNIPMFVLWV